MPQTEKQKTVPYAEKEIGFPQGCPAVPLARNETDRTAIFDVEYPRDGRRLTEKQKCEAFPQARAARAQEEVDRKRRQVEVLAKLESIPAYAGIGREAKAEIAEHTKYLFKEEHAARFLANVSRLMSDPAAVALRKIGPQTEARLFKQLSSPANLEKAAALVAVAEQDATYQRLNGTQRDRYAARIIAAIRDECPATAEMKAQIKRSLHEMDGEGSGFHRLNDKLKDALIEFTQASDSPTGCKYSLDLPKIEWLSDPEHKTVERLAQFDLRNLNPAHIRQTVGLLHGMRGFDTKKHLPEVTDYLQKLFSAPAFHTLNDEAKSDLIYLAQLDGFRENGTSVSMRRIISDVVTSPAFAAAPSHVKANGVLRLRAIAALAASSDNDPQGQIEGIGKLFSGRSRKFLVEFQNAYGSSGLEEQKKKLNALFESNWLDLQNPRWSPEQFAALSGNYSGIQQSYRRERIGENFEIMGEDTKPVPGYIEMVTFSDGQKLRLFIPKTANVYQNYELPMVDELLRELASTPPALRQKCALLIIDPDLNHARDASGTPAVMVARTEIAAIIVYPRHKDEDRNTKSTLYHELSHLLSLTPGSTTFGADDFRAWEKAVASDPATVSTYAQESVHEAVIEDIADAGVIYALAKTNPNPRAWAMAKLLYPGRMALYEKKLPLPALTAQSANKEGG